jgi:hypothetical protein
MRSKDALKRLGTGLVACLFFIGTAMGAEKSSVIKLATLAPMEVRG